MERPWNPCFRGMLADSPCLPLTACPTSRTMGASCQGELPCRPNIPAMPDQPPINVPKRARLQGHPKKNHRGNPRVILLVIRLRNLPGNFPGVSLRIILAPRAKARGPVLMAGLAMAHMDDQTPVLAPDQTHGPIPGQPLGLALARIRAEKPVQRVPRCAGPNLLQNQNHRKVCASTRPLLPRAIARVAMLTSLFLRVACALTASRNQTPRGACCHLKAFLLMGAFCRPRRLLPILCSTSPCRWCAL